MTNPYAFPIRDIMWHSRIKVGFDMLELFTNKYCFCFRTHWSHHHRPAEEEMEEKGGKVISTLMDNLGLDKF